MSKPSFLRRAFAALWNGITRIRQALANIVFLLIIVVIYFAYVGDTPEPLPERAALLLNLTGSVVDQKTQVEPLQAVLGEPSPATHEVLLRDVIRAIVHAAGDPAINSMVIQLDSLMSIGISKTQEIVAALEFFRSSGKPIVAVGDYYTQDQYLLASHADTVILHPLGGVAIEGYSSYRNYFREALEKLSVNMHVFRAGEHKSAMEPFMRDDMSSGEKEVTGRWLRSLWGQYTTSVESRRQLSAGAVDTYVNNFALRLAAQGGDSARAALEAGLVDKLLSRSEANDYLSELVGASNEAGLYEAVMFEHYIARQLPVDLPGPEGVRIAVITAQGNMLPGEQPAGTIGGDSLADLIRTTAEQETTKAIVLRVNSGGGSMFASEIIRQQVLKARASGIPVVVSMGAVAASGGYYIAAEADEIWATPSTITGSIGVFAAFPTFEELLQRLGVYTDGVGTTTLAGSLRADRPLNPQLVSALNSGVEFAYNSFVQIVADGRNLTLDQVDPLAQGRVWSAPDALQAGLVDKVGTLSEAIGGAAALAGVEEYKVDYVEMPRSPGQLLLQQLADRAASLQLWSRFSTSATLFALLQPVTNAVAEVGNLQDPRHLYLRCVPCSINH